VWYACKHVGGPAEKDGSKIPAAPSPFGPPALLRLPIIYNGRNIHLPLQVIGGEPYGERKNTALCCNYVYRSKLWLRPPWKLALKPLKHQLLLHLRHGTG
jgi:hypothetical protein